MSADWREALRFRHLLVNVRQEVEDILPVILSANNKRYEEIS